MVASSTALNKTSEAIAAALGVPGGSTATAGDRRGAYTWCRGALLLGPQVERRVPAGGRLARWPAGRHVRLGRTHVPEAVPRRDGRASGASIEKEVASHAAKGMRVLLAAYSPDTSTLSDEGDASVLPPDSRPYALVVLRDLLRKDAAATLERFREMGVDVRVISGDDPDTVATLARQAGLDVSRGVVSGPELEEMDEARFRVAAERTADLRAHHARR